MKKGRILLFSVALIALILSISGSTFAQEGTNCLGLSDADCALYEQFQSSQTLPVSTAMQASVSGEISVSGTQIPFTVNVSGAYVTDIDAFQATLDTFGAVTLRDLSLGDLVTLLQGVVGAWDAELFIDLSGIPGMEMMADGEPLGLYFVDGVAYMNGPLLALMMSDPGIEGVYGIDAFETINMLLSSVTMADLAQLGSGMAGGMGGMDDGMDGDGGMPGGMGGMDAFAEIFSQGFMQGLQQGMAGQELANLSEAELASFVSVARLEDETLNGETIIVFETTVDIAEVYTVSAIRDLIVASLEQQNLGDMMDVDALISGLETGMAGSKVTVLERYSQESNFLVGFDMNMDILIDAAEINAAMGMPSSGEGEDEQVNMTIAVNFMRENINQVEAITLPEGAQVIPLMQMLGGM